jgi:hypothetical protein
LEPFFGNSEYFNGLLPKGRAGIKEIRDGIDIDERRLF